MKFTIQKKGAFKARLASLDDFGSKKHSYTTPFFVGHTKAGNVPHLTPDVLQKVFTPEQPLMFCCSSIGNMRFSLATYPEGLSKYVGLPEYSGYMALHDPAIRTPSGFNTKNGIAVWCHKGKEMFTPDNYMALVESVKPIAYQALTDSDTPKDASNKRLSHSFNRSLTFLDACLRHHSDSEALKNCAVFGSVQGGFDLHQRIQSAKETAQREVSGFVIDGFHQNGPEVQHLDIDTIKDLLNTTIAHLPEDKPRIMHGAFSPLSILKAINCGIDIFDSSYPFIVTEEAAALIFSFTSPGKVKISLKDAAYKEDFTPLLSSCKCFTCKNFSKAYLHHLVACNELLAPVLLMVHNLYHFSQFFECIRTHLSEGTFSKLIDAFTN